MNQTWTMTRTVAAPYDEALEVVRARLADAGFGVLTEIDIAATLHTKLGVEVAPRTILGACRPELAHRALEADGRIAAVLPCNVVVTQESDARTRVEVFDPAMMATMSSAEGLDAIAAEARQRLSGMLDALSPAED